MEEIELLLQEKLQLVIPLDSYRKIMAYAEACDTEISGFADVEYDKETAKLIVGKVYLLEQTAGGANVHMDEEAVAKFNVEMIKKGVKQLPRLWWHSHVNMEAFFSGTDENTTEQLRNDTFNVSLVVNKRHDMKAKVNIYYEAYSTKIVTLFGETEEMEEEKKAYIDINELPIHVAMEYKEVPKTILAEVEKKVSKYTPQVYKPHKRGTLPHANPFILSNEDRAEFGQGASYTPPSRQFAHTLPKDRIRAEKKIAELGLQREWSYTYNEWVYRNPNTDIVWMDEWNVLSWNPSDWRDND
jgi:proteasome lid subunit RPN8/RPN11